MDDDPPALAKSFSIIIFDREAMTLSVPGLSNSCEHSTPSAMSVLKQEAACGV